METIIQNTKTSKKNYRSLIVINQSISNITRLNTTGQYDKTLLELEAEKEETELWIKQNTTIKRTKYIPSEIERKAIMAFNSDKRFSITE